MPIEIALSDIPAGYSLSTGRPGDTVTVATRKFLSSEDGDDFIRQLEGFPSIVLGKLPPERRPPPALIDHMLAIVRKDKTATVYVNELNVFCEMLAKRDLAVGEQVFGSDIADIRSIKFDGIEIPSDAGVLYIFSAGWRKGLFYDFAPIQPQTDGPRDYDLGVLLGQFYAYLLFQDLLKISEDAWNNMFAQGWFPFISLSTELTREMVNFALNGWNINELLPKIVVEVKDHLGKWQTKWPKKAFFADHLDVLNTAVERFCASDYVSTVSNLYPRIEGVMRSYHLLNRPKVRQSQSNLVDTVVSSTDPSTLPKILLLPEKFRRYLSDIYFGAFDQRKPEGVSRHTVAHGVAPQNALSEKASVIGFLILDQLSYYFAD